MFLWHITQKKIPSAITKRAGGRFADDKAGLTQKTQTQRVFVHWCSFSNESHMIIPFPSSKETLRIISVVRNPPARYVTSHVGIAANTNNYQAGIVNFRPRFYLSTYTRCFIWPYVNFPCGPGGGLYMCWGEGGGMVSIPSCTQQGSLTQSCQPQRDANYVSSPSVAGGEKKRRNGRPKGT